MNPGKGPLRWAAGIMVVLGAGHLTLLGCLIWHLAGRGVRVPAWVGWGVAVWCLVGGVLLVPSPYFAGTVAGVLVVVAARRTMTKNTMDT